MVNITCKGCGTRVVNPITCPRCGISAHPACLIRTGHPFSDGQFSQCKDNASSNPPSDRGPISAELINLIEIVGLFNYEYILGYVYIEDLPLETLFVLRPVE